MFNVLKTDILLQYTLCAFLTFYQLVKSKCLNDKEMISKDFEQLSLKLVIAFNEIAFSTKFVEKQFEKFVDYIFCFFQTFPYDFKLIIFSGFWGHKDQHKIGGHWIRNIYDFLYLLVFSKIVLTCTFLFKGENFFLSLNTTISTPKC